MEYIVKYKKSFISLKNLMLFVLFMSASVLLSHGMDEGHVEQASQGNFLDYIYIGAIHMLTGYDHILFLIGVIFFLTTFKDIFKFITVFTAGHSVTLIGATFLEIQMNYYLCHHRS